MLPYVLPENHRVTDVSPKLKFGSETGEQDTNGAGLPLWRISVKILYTDSDGDPASETIRISVPSRNEPTGLQTQKISTEGLVVGAANGNLWFRAANVTAEQATKASA